MGDSIYYKGEEFNEVWHEGKEYIQAWYEGKLVWEKNDIPFFSHGFAKLFYNSFSNGTYASRKWHYGYTGLPKNIGIFGVPQGSVELSLIKTINVDKMMPYDYPDYPERPFIILQFNSVFFIIYFPSRNAIPAVSKIGYIKIDGFRAEYIQQEWDYDLKKDENNEDIPYWLINIYKNIDRITILNNRLAKPLGDYCQIKNLIFYYRQGNDYVIYDDDDNIVGEGYQEGEIIFLDCNQKYTFDYYDYSGSQYYGDRSLDYIISDYLDLNSSFFTDSSTDSFFMENKKEKNNFLMFRISYYDFNNSYHYSIYNYGLNNSTIFSKIKTAFSDISNKNLYRLSDMKSIYFTAGMNVKHLSNITTIQRNYEGFYLKEPLNHINYYTFNNHIDKDFYFDGRNFHYYITTYRNVINNEYQIEVYALYTDIFVINYGDSIITKIDRIFSKPFLLVDSEERIGNTDFNKKIFIPKNINEDYSLRSSSKMIQLNKYIEPGGNIEYTGVIKEDNHSFGFCSYIKNMNHDDYYQNAQKQDDGVAITPYRVTVYTINDETGEKQVSSRGSNTTIWRGTGHYHDFILQNEEGKEVIVDDTSGVNPLLINEALSTGTAEIKDDLDNIQSFTSYIFPKQIYNNYNNTEKVFKYHLTDSYTLASKFYEFSFDGNIYHHPIIDIYDNHNVTSDVYIYKSNGYMNRPELEIYRTFSESGIEEIL